MTTRTTTLARFDAIPLDRTSRNRPPPGVARRDGIPPAPGRVEEALSGKMTTLKDSIQDLQRRAAEIYDRIRAWHDGDVKRANAALRKGVSLTRAEDVDDGTRDAPASSTQRGEPVANEVLDSVEATRQVMHSLANAQQTSSERIQARALLRGHAAVPRR